MLNAHNKQKFYYIIGVGSNFQFKRRAIDISWQYLKQEGPWTKLGEKKYCMAKINLRIYIKTFKFLRD